jgi:hypothetical protein
MKAQYLNILSKDFLLSQHVSGRRSLSAIARETGTSRETVANYLRRYNLHIHGKSVSSRRYSPLQNIEGFYGPASDWHAYWLGFVAADGCVYRVSKGSRRPRNLLRLRLKADDHAHLENLRKGLQTDSPVKLLRDNDGYKYAQLELNGEHLINALARWGIVQNKTATMPFPSMAEEHLGAYIRGYFDGDGTIYWRLRPDHSGKNPQPVCRFISGSPNFLRGLDAALNKWGIETKTPYKNGKSNAHVLPLSNAKTNLRIFASRLYDGATVWLERKRASLSLINNFV